MTSDGSVSGNDCPLKRRTSFAHILLVFNLLVEANGETIKLGTDAKGHRHVTSARAHPTFDPRSNVCNAQHAVTITDGECTIAYTDVHERRRIKI